MSIDDFEVLKDELGVLQSESRRLQEELKQLSRREYYEQRYIKCGRQGCKDDRHGPYWYAFFYERGEKKMKSRYIGKQLPKMSEEEFHRIERIKYLKQRIREIDEKLKLYRVMLKGILKSF
jgi:hypothetical protein